MLYGLSQKNRQLHAADKNNHSSYKPKYSRICCKPLCRELLFIAAHVKQSVCPHNNIEYRYKNRTEEHSLAA